MSTSSQNGKYPEDIDMIIPQKNGKGGIYISNIQAARNPNTLWKLNIKAVISVAKGGFLTHSQQQLPNYLYLPALDSTTFDLSIHFDKAFDFIDRNRRKSNLLVHCVAGISRSATIVIAYLMKKNSLTFMEAFATVKRMRQIVRPNDGFVRQLQQFQDKLKIGNPDYMKENRGGHTRNRSCDLLRRPIVEERKQKPMAMAISSEDKIKPINLEEKINALRQKFGTNSRRLINYDSQRLKVPEAPKQSIIIDQATTTGPEQIPRTKRHLQLRRKISLNG